MLPGHAPALSVSSWGENVERIRSCICSSAGLSFSARFLRMMLLLGKIQSY